jgi:putative membrane protein
MDLNKSLALTNVLLTTVSLICMSLGYRAIKRKHVRIHYRYMLSAFITSSIFLVFFVIRYSLFGSIEYKSSGISYWIFKILFYTHEPLAVINAPLVAVTLFTGLTKRFRSHRELAKTAFIIWYYVSCTGISIAIFLYLLQ